MMIARKLLTTFTLTTLYFGCYSGLAAAFTYDRNHPVNCCALCLQTIPKLHHYYVIKPYYYNRANHEPCLSFIPSLTAIVCSECLVMSDWIIAAPPRPVANTEKKYDGLVFLKLEKQSKQPIKRAQ
jgi:hypothetical protein